MFKKFNFIFLDKRIDIYAESFEQAEIIAKEIMNELERLKSKE
ncbi:hypothetical protein PDN55_15050 [Bacillus cereus]|nr:hypothetical protein [Bacillus cereus]